MTTEAMPGQHVFGGLLSILFGPIMILIGSNDSFFNHFTNRSVHSKKDFVMHLAQRKSSHEPTNKRPFGIGGSDIGAILGLSPYRSAAQVWAELVSGAGRRGTDALHLRFGRHAESFVASEYERATGLWTTPHPQTIFHRSHPHLFAHVDRLVSCSAEDDGSTPPLARACRVLECKTANAFSREDWGEAGSDRVPPSYLVQCAWYMALSELPQADLAVLIGNNDFRIYHLPRDLELEELIIERANTFWHEHVLARTPPRPASPEDASILYPRSLADTTVAASPQILETVRRYQACQGRLKLLEQESESLKTEIMAFMGEQELLSHEGMPLVSWRSARPTRRLDGRALSLAHPEIAAQFTNETAGARRFLLKEHA